MSPVNAGRALARGGLAVLGGDSLVRNSVYIMATSLVTAALGYVYWLVAAHLYPAEAIGLAAALLSGTALVSSLGGVGMSAALIQYLPRRRAGAAWSVTLTAALAASTGLTAAGGVLLVTLVLPRLRSTFHEVASNPVFAALVVAAIVLTTVSLVLDGAFVAERRSEGMLARNTVFSLVKIPVLSVPVLFGLHDAHALFSTWLVGLVAGAAAGFLLVSRLGRAYRLTLDGVLPELRVLRGAFLGHHLIALGGQLPMYVLPFLVVTRVSVTANAYFYVSWMIGSLFFIASNAVASALFAEGSHDPDENQAQTWRALKVITLLVVPGMALMAAFGDTVLGLFGSEYAEHGTALLLLLVASAVPDGITNVYVTRLRVQHKLGRAATLNVGMAVVALTLAWPLLGRMGIAGAGVAWLVAQMLGTLFVSVDARVGRATIRSVVQAPLRRGPRPEEAR
ncbi:MAG: lipopolysaccharide biosynthesis protein [Actinomycetota bacterium]|nr:lipopolysaccharide biosynthesis protein [Actinomycetota bacterium]